MSRGRILWIIGGALAGLAGAAALVRRFGLPLERRPVVLEDETPEPGEISAEAQPTADGGEQPYEKPAVTDETDDTHPV